ncbi:hypothetical protein KDL67_13295, partial [bacterium]|nr:hypothetical protein [bacterium]
ERLFRREDWERGHLSVLDRQGQELRIPLMSLTVAIVVNEEQRYTHVGQISDAAFELKKYGKTFQGSTVVKERRGHAGEDEEDARHDESISHAEPESA